MDYLVSKEIENNNPLVGGETKTTNYTIPFLGTKDRSLIENDREEMIDLGANNVVDSLIDTQNKLFDLSINNSENQEHQVLTTSNTNVLDVGNSPTSLNSSSFESGCFSTDEIRQPSDFIELDGETLTIDKLYKLGYHGYKLKLCASTVDRVKNSRKVVENVLLADKAVYGINTGIGNFASKRIPAEKLVELQYNIVRSHAAGVGKPLSISHIKMLLTLRINVMAKGYSGISLETLLKYVDAFNSDILPFIPEQGTVGASGDLCPLAHLALGIIGEGLLWDENLHAWTEAQEILKRKSFEPLQLKPKEGISLINGTCFISAIGCDAIYRAEKLAVEATIISCLTLESLKGSYRITDLRIHNVRPYRGQKLVACLLRDLLIDDNQPSQIGASHKDCQKVQDSYTIRCIPQVHGIVFDTIEFAKNILTTEINSATDNPLVFSDNGDILSGGNFHGEYPSKALDYLAIGIHELASISERRIEQLVNTDLSHLPPFLTYDGGLNSGFMMAHVTAASLVSENKVLCHPSSTDSIPTSASKEDHVSMGGFAARKALDIVKNVENVLAIELLAACQALEFLRPLKSSPVIEAVYEYVRSHVEPLKKDRMMWKDIEIAKDMIHNEQILRVVKPFLENCLEYDVYGEYFI